MASAARQSAELADLDSLIHITQHLSDLLDYPEPQPRLLWPPKLEPTFPRTAPLPTKLTMPRFSNVNGSKLHTYSMKAAPYPVSFDQPVLDSDICDRITLKKLCKNGLTLHDFPDGPPDLVLDIGTGSGNWVLEAASQWNQTTRFVGLDLVEIQPHLSLNGPLAASHGRIQWVQGNALDELPFSTGSFDFVRMCKIAMGVPENKWHHLLEEAVRVLKPAGILEIIEEDVIFPYRAPPDDTSRSTAVSVSIHGDHESSGSSADHSIRTFPAASTRRPLSIVVPKTLNPRTRSRSLGASSNNVPPNVAYVKSTYSHSSSASTLSAHSSEWISILPTLTTSEAEALGLSVRDPRDHSIIYHAWNAMLDQRFITSKPVSLLAFYLTIHLESVRSHEPLQVIAPPPSYLSQTRQSGPPSPGEEDLYDIQLGTIDAAPSSKLTGSGVLTTRDASMHLRRVLQVVLGCAEALWPQVKSRYPDMPRDCFDFLLRDFELDMLDRIDTRSALKSFGWDSQMGTSDLRKWRERVAAVATLPHPEEPPLICRSIRGFVGVKGSS